jgi:hypothetical protein
MVAAVKSEIDGINFANQCDMSSAYENRRASALKQVLEWVKTPDYRRRLGETLDGLI